MNSCECGWHPRIDIIGGETMAEHQTWCSVHRDQAGEAARREREHGRNWPSTWEERMAQRTKDRAAERYVADEVARTPQSWMNDWPRIGLTTMLTGTTVRCVCCGKFQGVTCVAFDEDYSPPEHDPVWPFGEDDCPLCKMPEPRS